MENTNAKKTMRFFNLIILDESGSMYSIAKQAVGGVNETIQSIRNAQKKNEGQQHFITFVTFNSDRTNEICTCQAADTVKEITMEDYNPDSCTPLYDAMGFSLLKLEEQVKPEDKVLVTIVTDGYENSSYKFDGAAIKRITERLKEKDWVFQYIGANQDVEMVASTIGVECCMEFDATPEETAVMFNKLSKQRAQLYEACCCMCEESNVSFRKMAEDNLID